MGLKLCKSLAVLHAERLSVESLGAGQGATFTLCLPLDTTDFQATPAPAAARCHCSRRVLVIENNEDAARTLGAFWELSDFEVGMAFEGHGRCDG